MTNFQYEEDPIIVSRDAGYSKTKLLSSENIKKSQERIENPNIVTGNYKLKELLAEVGIIVNPEKMTNCMFIQNNIF
jgi:hypothetical protein